MAMSKPEAGELVPFYGERFLSPATQPAQFATGVSRHHRRSYDDYDIAKAHILQAVGDISDMQIIGRKVLLGVFIRPNTTSTGLFLGTKEPQEDQYQHKAALILKLGPGAFSGADSYLDEMFGERDENGDLIAGSGRSGRPRIGDWIFANASAGIQINLAGDGCSRPQGRDPIGRTIDLFEWDGWPCRVVEDDCFLGRVVNPQSVV